MARAKHRPMIEFKAAMAFKRKCDRAHAHDELLKQHRAHKKSRTNANVVSSVEE